jgi:hypothetical protein
MSLRIQDVDESRLVAGDIITIRCRELVDPDGRPYDLSDAAAIYCTVKESLADADDEAIIQIDSVTKSAQFKLTNAQYGEIDVVLLPDDTVLLAPGTIYFIDIKALWADGPVLSIVNSDNFQVIDRVTDEVLGA